MTGLELKANQLPSLLRRVPFWAVLTSWTAVMGAEAWAFQAGGSVKWALLLALLGAVAYLNILAHVWSDPESRSERILAVAGCAVAVRLLLIAAPPLLSDDIYRYVWEGRVIVAGHNPFALAPDAAELVPLRDELWSRINYPEISAIYPPLTQAIFALVAALGGGVGAMKLTFTGIELGAAAILWRWLGRAGLPQDRIAVWLLHPLVVLEVAGNGHLDALLVLGVALTFLFAARPTIRGATGAAGGLVVATLAKLVPLVALPHLARLFPRRAWVLFLAVPAVVALSYVPFLGAGGDLFRAMDNYESRWRNNDSVFRAILWTTEHVDPDGAIFKALPWDLDARLLKRRADSVPGDPNQVEARLIVYALFGALWLFVLWNGGPWDRQWLWLFGGALLLSPVNHPWYLLMLIPCTMRKFRPEVLWWSLTIPATYLALDRYWAEGVWEPSTFAWSLQYGGLAAILLVMVLKRWKERTSNPIA
ncbi:hypothetical protein KQI84_10880 [bacterium]|nr:hypothetical protein [bacterium]